MNSTANPFNPDVYWEERGVGYDAFISSPQYERHRMCQEKWLMKHLVSLSPHNVLDFGCGTGKFFSLFRDVPDVFAYDRSESMIRLAREEAKNCGVDVHFSKPESPGLTITPYGNYQFDLIVASEVLAHLSPENIGDMVRELRRILKKNGKMAVITAQPFDNTRRAAHNWSHDYDEVFDGLFDIEEEMDFMPYRYMWVSRHD